MITNEEKFIYIYIILLFYIYIYNIYIYICIIIKTMCPHGYYDKSFVDRHFLKKNLSRKLKTMH